MQKYGRWPWPREIIAKVIDEVIEGGAKLIAFDIIFSEPQDSQLKSLDQVAQTLSSNLPGQTQKINEVIAVEKENQDHDAKLSSVIEKHQDNLVLGAVYQEITSPLRPFQDSCLLKIRWKEGAQDYWEENEEIPIGVSDEGEFRLPDAWNEIIREHLSKIDQNVFYEWIKENPNHSLAQYFTSQGLKLSSQAVITLSTLFVQGQRTKFDETLEQLSADKKSKLSWTNLKNNIAPKTTINLRYKMKVENDSYCFRYLTSEDELATTFRINWQNIGGDSAAFKDMTYEEAVAFIIDANDFYTVSQAEAWLFNIPKIQENTLHTGAFNANQDKDGSIRRTKLFMRMDKLFTPSLAFKSYLVSTGYNATIQMIPHPIEEGAKVASTIRITDDEDNTILNIPTDYIGQLPINYAGPQKMFSYLSAGELLDGTDELVVEQRKKNDRGQWETESIKVKKNKYLKGKHFIFGATATGIYDLRVTPFEEDYPGVETHANVLDNLLRQDYLRTSRQESTIMPIAILILGLVFSFIVARFGAILG
ncbi:MAG: CHASE2 domain-containing protein, partial [Bdellovibrionales bacterium]|nr:CHASE2 domain-containing protein [Bdellovibrionales bacterium]